jgi:hypothetical protein
MSGKVQAIVPARAVAYPRKPSVLVPLLTGTDATTELSVDAGDFPARIRHSFPGLVFIEIEAGTNSCAERRATIVLARRGRTLAQLELVQLSGEWTSARMLQQVRAPLAIEFGIAAQYVGEQLADLPPVIKEPLYAAAGPLLEALAAALGLARAAWTEVPNAAPFVATPPRCPAQLLPPTRTVAPSSFWYPLPEIPVTDSVLSWQAFQTWIVLGQAMEIED